MRDLVHRPDTPWRGFMQGAVTVGVGAGLPIVLGVVIGTRDWRSLGVGLACAVGVTVVSGLGLALWRAVQGWAYDRFTEGL